MGDGDPESRVRRIADESADPLAPAIDPEWISRRIHDGIGHRLTLLGFHARLLSAEDDDLGHRSRWSGIAMAVDAIFEELYGLLDELSHGRPGRAGGGGLGDFVGQVRSLGVDLDLLGGTVIDAIDESRAVLVEAACREGVVNALKHGERGRIVIRLARDSRGSIAVTVSSPGAPAVPAPISGGHGLGLLRERFEAVGGRLWSSVHRDRHLLGAWLPRSIAAGHPYPARDGQAVGG